MSSGWHYLQTYTGSIGNQNWIHRNSGSKHCLDSYFDSGFGLSSPGYRNCCYNYSSSCFAFASTLTLHRSKVVRSCCLDIDCFGFDCTNCRVSANIDCYVYFSTHCFGFLGMTNHCQNIETEIANFQEYNCCMTMLA